MDRAKSRRTSSNHERRRRGSGATREWQRALGNQISPDLIMASTVLAEVRISSWEDYLSIKQEILRNIKLIIAVVGNLKQFIGIARDTPLSKIDRVPELIAEVVNCDANLNLSVCRLSSISDYSIDFMILMESSYEDVGDFFNALARVNRGILVSFTTNDIEIPLPTSVEIQKTMPGRDERGGVFKNPRNRAESGQDRQPLDLSVRCPAAEESDRLASPEAGSGMDKPRVKQPAAAEAPPGRASARRPAHQTSASSDERHSEPLKDGLAELPQHQPAEEQDQQLGRVVQSRNRTWA